MASEAERIAKGLTKAQRMVLPDFPVNENGWFFPPTRCGRKCGNIASALWMKGLFTRIYNGGGYLYRWTDLGRSVVATLRDRENRDEG